MKPKILTFDSSTNQINLVTHDEKIINCEDTYRFIHMMLNRQNCAVEDYSVTKILAVLENRSFWGQYDWNHREILFLWVSVTILFNGVY